MIHMDAHIWGFPEMGISLKIQWIIISGTNDSQKWGYPMFFPYDVLKIIHLYFSGCSRNDFSTKKHLKKQPAIGMLGIRHNSTEILGRQVHRTALSALKRT